MPLPTHRQEELIQGVYDGKITVEALPEWLYHYTVYELDGSFFAGFGELPKGDIPVTQKAVSFRSNIGRFSGAKTFQEVNDLTKYVFDENGKKRPFAQFKEKALKIDEAYNVNWLRTEQDSVFMQSQNARKWMQFEELKDVLPYLKYVTVGDERVRASHKALDGIVARVDDPIWDRIMPQNDWGCRCIVIQLAEADVTRKAVIEKKTAKLRADFKKNPEFDMNPGKTEYIFKESGKGKASYFKVPRKYNDDLKNNFGFPSASEVTGRYI